jgi:hypothetical protein
MAEQQPDPNPDADDGRGVNGDSVSDISSGDADVEPSCYAVNTGGCSGTAEVVVGPDDVISVTSLAGNLQLDAAGTLTTQMQPAPARALLHILLLRLLTSRKDCRESACRRAADAAALVDELVTVLRRHGHIHATDEEYY